MSNHPDANEIWLRNKFLHTNDAVYHMNNLLVGITNNRDKSAITHCTYCRSLRTFYFSRDIWNTNSPQFYYCYQHVNKMPTRGKFLLMLHGDEVTRILGSKSWELYMNRITPCE